MTQKTIFTPAADLVVGQTVRRAGDVTQLNHLLGTAGTDLEIRLGYETGRLRLGWYLLLLEESVGPGEFTWGGTTEFSGGTHPDRVEEFKGQEFRIPVQDLKRYDLYKQFGSDGARSDAALDAFLARQLEFLNDRKSHNRIAKVVPVLGENKDEFWLVRYPDAPRGHGVKQWTLQVLKNFRIAAKVPAGAKYLGGGRVGLGAG